MFKGLLIGLPLGLLLWGGIGMAVAVFGWTIVFTAFAMTMGIIMCVGMVIDSIRK